VKTVTVHRASDIQGQPEVKPCTIVIAESFGSDVTATNALAHVINYEANAIADALFESLPQAVGNRVMMRLMERYATNYLGGPRR
jgi:hypothetical protein